MKIRVTRNILRNNFNIVVAVPYCALQNLLKFHDADAYNDGVYGWNYDVYFYGDIALTTGYRPYGDWLDHTFCRKYDEEARDIVQADNMTYKEKATAIDEIFVRFLYEIRECYR